MVWIVKIDETFEDIKEYYFRDKINAVKFILLQLEGGLELSDFEIYELESVYSDEEYKDKDINYDKIKRGVIRYWKDKSKVEILLDTISKLKLNEEEMKELGLYKKYFLDKL